MTQVPYQPGEARDPVAVLERVGDVAVRLSAGRFGVVLGPASVLAGELTPFSPAERARADLLKGYMVEAVIRLPGGLVPFRPGYETALWVVTQARDSRWRGRVLIADVSDRELTHEVVSDLVEDVTTWRRDGYVPGAHSRVFGQQVAVRDLIDPPRPLTVSSRPASHRERAEDAARRVALLTQRGADLDRIGATATGDRRHVPTELLAAVDPLAAAEPHGHRETVGALVKSKRLALHQGTRIKPEHITATGHHVVLGPDEVLGIRRPGERRMDRALFARAHPSARLTAPGDVLVTTAPQPGVMVDTRRLRDRRVPGPHPAHPRRRSRAVHAPGPGRAAVRRRLGHPRGRGGPRGPFPGRPARDSCSRPIRSAVSTGCSPRSTPAATWPAENSTCSANYKTPPSAASSMEH